MKKMLLLIWLCLAPTASYTMGNDLLKFVAEDPDALKHFKNARTKSEQERKEKEAAEQAKKKQLEYNQKISKQGIIKGTVTRTLDQVDKKLENKIEKVKKIGDEFTNKIGDEARTTINSAVGDVVKGLFCSTLAILGGAILYKTLCNDDKDANNDPEKQKNRNIKLLTGAALLLVGGGLGFYVFR